MSFRQRLALMDAIVSIAACSSALRRFLVAIAASSSTVWRFLIALPALAATAVATAVVAVGGVVISSTC